jgi:glycosyltransferase involved in cell wall biosynthesis
VKNLLFVIESLHCGGAEKSLITLLRYIDFNKYNVDLLLIKKGGEFEKFIPRQVHVIHKELFTGLGFFSKMSAKTRFWLLRKQNTNRQFHTAQLFWKALGNSIKMHEKEYDIAIAYNQGFATYFVAEKTLAVKKIAWLNTDYQKAGYNASFDYIRYTQFEKIIAVSRENQLSLIKAMDAINKALPSNIIKDISDEETIYRLSLEKDSLPGEENIVKILTVARLVKAKGLYLAIEACELLKANGKDIKWYVIGEGDDRPYLEALIREKKLQEVFILLGYKENPYPFMRSCDLYIQTSLFEGLGITLIEAAILKKPIVTTNFPTASTIITHNETGVICEMDAQSIAGSITNYLDNTDFTNKIVENLSKIKNNDKEISLEKFNQLLAI